MLKELSSEQFFNEVIDYVKPHTPYLTRAEKTVYANCPICQSAKLDTHHLYFGIWCHYRKVYLGCHNPLCNFGTSNNILDFIQRIEGVDFQTALAIWQEFVGVEPVSEERYVSDLDELHEACTDAFSGNGKYRQNHIIRLSKRTLIRDFGWHHDELFAEVYSQMVRLYSSKSQMNRKYLIQVTANSLQKLVRGEIQRAEIEISEHRLSTTECDMNLSNDILDYASYDSEFIDPLIEREDRENEQKALKMAHNRLDVIEMKIIYGTISFRKASLITGIPKSTIAHRLKKKLEKISQECL